MVRIELAKPPRQLSPNYTVGSLGSRLAKAAKVKRYRESARLATLSAMNGQIRQWAGATVQVTFHVTDPGRKRDRDNLLASLKPGFDGMADAGLVVNDSGLTYLPVQVVKADRACVMVDVWAQT